MKVTDDKLFACEQERASRERQARQREGWELKEGWDGKQPPAMSAGETLFWRAFYVLAHIAAILLVVATLCKFWGES